MKSNINIIQIKNMLNSSIQQGNGGESPKFTLSEEQVGEVNTFLNSIDDNVELLQIKNAMINGKSNAKYLIQCYHRDLINELLTYRISSFNGLNKSGSFWGDEICESATKMLEIRNKFIDLYISILQINPQVIELSELLNDLLAFNYLDCDALEQPELAANLIYDNFRIVLNEIFVHVIAYLLKEQNFYEVHQIIKYSYQIKCVKNIKSPNPITQYFSIDFHWFNVIPSYTLEDMNRQAQNNVYSKQDKLYKRFLHSRIYEKYVNLFEIQQADTLLYYLSLAHKNKDEFHFWLPNYYNMSFQTLDVFLRSSSKTFFDKVIFLFDCTTIEEFNKHLLAFRDHFHQIEWLGTHGYIHTNILDVFNHHYLCNQK